MGDPLKTFFSVALVRRMATTIAAVHPAFPSQAFVRQASRGLDDLALLDRAKQISRALAAHLPQDYPSAIRVLLDSLGPALPSDELIGVGMEPFFYMPHLMFVADHGLAHFELSMRAQHELTKRFTAEFSIRAYLTSDFERTIAVLRTWARDPDPHVRRLVSEGTRLRLPWGKRVPQLDANPEVVIGLLELLKDDPTTLVRRSVANNLNDLGKVHPPLLVRTCEAWLVDASPERRKLVEHALRSAVKRGEPGALRLLGYSGKPAVAIERVRFEPARVAIGDDVAIRFILRNTGRRRQDLLVDLAVHFVKARGPAPKVFKLDRVSLAPREQIELQTRVSLAVHTTRKPRPGTHAVEALVNGVAIPVGSFVVTP